jgi:hypothetical protein
MIVLGSISFVAQEPLDTSLKALLAETGKSVFLFRLGFTGKGNKFSDTLI